MLLNAKLFNPTKISQQINKKSAIEKMAFFLFCLIKNNELIKLINNWLKYDNAIVVKAFSFIIEHITIIKIITNNLINNSNLNLLKFLLFKIIRK